jgi:ATP-dependent exoDNAse (exonuclease V) beta subunit
MPVLPGVISLHPLEDTSMDDQNNLSTDEELKSIKARLEALEKPAKQGTSGGGSYSPLRRRLNEVALQVEALHDTVVQVLREHPEFHELYEEVYNDLKKKHETRDEADYDDW